MISDFNNIRVAWVDLDDTIIDFSANSKSALARLYKDEHLESMYRSSEEWIERYESVNTELWKQYSRNEISRDFLRIERFRRPLNDAGVPYSLAEELSRRFDPIYLTYLAMEKRLVPGARELLSAIRRNGWVTGVLSNGFKDVQYRKISNCGIEDDIDLVVLSDDIGVNKPSPEIFSYAMEKSGITSPKAHLMIGDNPATDIEGAIRAGWHSIWYCAHGKWPDTTPAGAIKVSSLSEATALIST